MVRDLPRIWPDPAHAIFIVGWQAFRKQVAMLLQRVRGGDSLGLLTCCKTAASTGRTGAARSGGGQRRIAGWRKAKKGSTTMIDENRQPVQREVLPIRNEPYT
jgi:hypothetical protein